MAPLLLGVVPFGLVAGAAPVAAGFDLIHAIGLSTIVFAGASQLAMVDVLASSGGAAVAVVTALTINMRMLLYSASLARPLAHLPLGRRLFASYFLVDQAYALSIVRWDGTDDRDGRLPYYLAIGGTLWCSWVTSTIVGALVGASVPDQVPLDFAVPLVFLVLLIPVLDRWPAVVAAATGGVAAVVATQIGAERLSVVIGGVVGIAAGAIAEGRDPRPVGSTDTIEEVRELRDE